MTWSAKRALGITATLWAMIIGSTTTDAAGRKSQYVPVPGYVCTVGRAFEDEVWIMRRLDEKGVQHDAHMDWKLRGGDIWQPGVNAIWSTDGDRPLEIDDGAVFLQWSPRLPPKSRAPRKLTIELSTRARAQPWPRALMTSTPGYPSQTTMLMTSWSDMRAYARGADRLFVILRDRRGQIFQQAALAPSAFADAEAKIAAAVARMERMSASFRSECSHENDISDNDIVIS